jgi:hypothetical protein
MIAMKNPKATVKLIRHFNQQLKAQDRTTAAKLKGMAKAVKVARVAADRRLKGMNEFRQQLNDQSKTFITRTELYAVATLVMTLATVLARYFAK